MLFRSAAFVAKSRKALGDNVSLTPMDGRTKALAAQALDALAEANAAATRQSEEKHHNLKR